MHNPKLDLAQRIVLETGSSLFLTGKAGTGKTTFLRELAAKTRKRLVVTAPTGIAAINAGGVTLHSFFQLDFSPFVPGMHGAGRRPNAFSKEKIKIIRGLDLLVIDEVSMVRADLLDAVDDVLRRFRDRTLPFGGVQLLLIGDLYQLPPVVVESERRLIETNYHSPYFFDSKALSQLDYITIELDKVYRQNDSYFVGLLNDVRDGHVSSDVISRLNSRYIRGFRPKDNEGYVRLTTHNHMAKAINEERLEALPGNEVIFRAKVTGNFPASSYPAEDKLSLKLGERVMFVKNDPEKNYFNGMLGEITDIDDDYVMVTPDGSDHPAAVSPVEWENVSYEVDEASNDIKAKVVGTFSQIPLKAAWAITIHKSQGLTFDKAIIDASSSFTHGQTYVALSRCRSLEGLVLEKPLSAASIISDPTVSGFMCKQLSCNINDDAVSELAHSYYLHLAIGMFNFRPIFNALEGLSRLYSENFMKVFPQAVMNFIDVIDRKKSVLLPIYDKFLCQIRQLDGETDRTETNVRILRRIKDASNYFLPQLEEIIKAVESMPLDHDNKKVVKKLQERLELFYHLSSIRKNLLETFREKDFDVAEYLELKASGNFEKISLKKKSTDKVMKSEKSADNHNPALYDALRQWRNMRAKELEIPPFTILSNKSLLKVANEMPEDEIDLLAIPGIGKVIAKRYGDDLLRIVGEFRKSVTD